MRVKIFIARRCFKCNVFRILLSEFDEDLKEPSSGVDERSYVIAMSVIITSAVQNYVGLALEGPGAPTTCALCARF